MSQPLVFCRQCGKLILPHRNADFYEYICKNCHLLEKKEPVYTASSIDDTPQIPEAPKDDYNFKNKQASRMMVKTYLEKKNN